MILFLGGTLGLGVTMITSPESLAKNDATYQANPQKARQALAALGVTFVIISVPPLIPMFPALVWPRGRIGWWLGVAVIIAGTFTMCGWVFSIPLAFGWGNANFRRSCGLQA